MPTFAFTVDDATAVRITEAVGNRMGLVDGQGQPRNATAAEVKQFLISYLKGQVRNAETDMERRKIAVAEMQVT